jgi:hypothetical protein
MAQHLLVTANVYFVSVKAALKLKEKDLYFIGNVKQCSKRFPMEVLANTTLPKQGLRTVLASIDESGETELIVISWVDCNRRFFIATTCGLGEGEMITGNCLRQLDKSGRALPQRVIIEVRQPMAVEKYYAGAGTIDMHNRIRADKLQMDRNLGTKHCDKRFKLGVLGIICVNTYLFFQQVTGGNNKSMSCHEFFGRLADDLIKNQEGVCVTRAAADQDAGGINAAPASVPMVRRTLKMKPGGRGHCTQGRCGRKGCNKHTTYVCSKCTHSTNPRQKQFWFCNPTMVEGSECFRNHVAEAHKEHKHE